MSKDDTVELKGITNLLGYFKVYTQIVYFFAYPTIIVPL